jgi:3-oxoacyl-[acyl-carrier protein] reductase
MAWRSGDIDGPKGEIVSSWKKKNLIPHIRRFSRGRASIQRLPDVHRKNEKYVNKPSGFNFAGQTALITGSSEGIGLCTAAVLAAHGAAVIINGRDEEKLSLAERRIKAAGPAGVLALRGDVTDPAVRKNIVEQAIRSFGKIDILVNNVGGGSNVHRIEDITDDEWQKGFDLNLAASFGMCREIVPFMRRNGYGRIVNVSSVAGRFKGRLSGPAYSAAKAALQGLTRHLAWDLAPENITVNAVAPGFVDTPRAVKKFRAFAEEEQIRFIQQIPMRRFASPDEIAWPIVFLASPAASYISGITMDVNGGYYMA